MGEGGDHRAVGVVGQLPAIGQVGVPESQTVGGAVVGDAHIVIAGSGLEEALVIVPGQGDLHTLEDIEDIPLHILFLSVLHIVAGHQHCRSIRCQNDTLIQPVRLIINGKFTGKHVVITALSPLGQRDQHPFPPVPFQITAQGLPGIGGGPPCQKVPGPLHIHAVVDGDHEPNVILACAVYVKTLIGGFIPAVHLIAHPVMLIGGTGFGNADGSDLLPPGGSRVIPAPAHGPAAQSKGKGHGKGHDHHPPAVRHGPLGRLIPLHRGEAGIGLGNGHAAGLSRTVSIAYLPAPAGLFAQGHVLHGDHHPAQKAAGEDPPAGKVLRRPKGRGAKQLPLPLIQLLPGHTGPEGVLPGEAIGIHGIEPGQHHPPQPAVGGAEKQVLKSLKLAHQGKHHHKHHGKQTDTGPQRGHGPCHGFIGHGIEKKGQHYPQFGKHGKHHTHPKGSGPPLVTGVEGRLLRPLLPIILPDSPGQRLHQPRLGVELQTLAAAEGANDAENNGDEEKAQAGLQRAVRPDKPAADPHRRQCGQHQYQRKGKAGLSGTVEHLIALSRPEGDEQRQPPGHKSKKPGEQGGQRPHNGPQKGSQGPHNIVCRPLGGGTAGGRFRAF